MRASVSAATWSRRWRNIASGSALLVTQWFLLVSDSEGLQPWQELQIRHTIACVSAKWMPLRATTQGSTAIPERICNQIRFNSMAVGRGLVWLIAVVWHKSAAHLLGARRMPRYGPLHGLPVAA